MSSDDVTTGRFAVAIKGVRKRPRETSESSEDSEDFHGCRDSPSPSRQGSSRRAARSRPKHHRVILETPKIHRHDFEWRLEELWQEFGVEYRSDRSSSDISAMSFFGGPASSSASGSATVSTAVSSRRIMMIQPSSASQEGAANLQVPAPNPSVRTSQRQASSSALGRQ